MSNKSTTAISVLALVVAIAFGFIAVHQNSQQTSQTSPKLGAASSPNAPAGPLIENYVPGILYNRGYYSNLGIYTTAPDNGFGDIGMQFSRVVMSSTSTVPCSMITPSVRSKMLSYVLNITSATSTNSLNWILASSTSNSATTTVLASANIFSGNHVYSFSPVTATTSTTGAAELIFGPSTYINIGILATGADSTNGAPYQGLGAGVCTALFQELD